MTAQNVDESVLRPSGEIIEFHIDLLCGKRVKISASDYIWNHFCTCHLLKNWEIAEIIAHNCYCELEERKHNKVRIHPDLDQEYGSFTINGESKTIAIYGLIPMSFSL